MNINQELSKREFIQREHNILHSSYEQELEFYSAVSSGDIETVNRLYTPLAAEGHGKLSKDSVRNFKYHLIISIAMIARFCVDGGMSSETAYTISDIYINKVDELNDLTALGEIHKEMILEYTKRMQKVQSGQAYSKNVLKCLDYIYENIYNGITAGECAEKLGLSPQYLSRIFHSEVGITVSEYIMSKRIQAAENMLKFSEYSSVDIGNYLNFSSHSHFIHSFRKHTGLTPKQYREKNYRASWKKNHN